MKVSVIICTYSMDRFQDTIEAVNSVLVQSYNNIELIIAVDHNEEVLENLQKALPDIVKFAFNDKTRGLSDTRNVGIKIATGDIIAFIDDDAIADERWIESLLINYNDPSVFAVGGKLLPLWENSRPWWFPEELDWTIGCTFKGHPANKCELRNLIGCNMSFRRDAFNKAGLFSSLLGRVDQIPLGGEETDLCIRIKNKIPISKIVYDPEAIVNHKVTKNRENIKYLLDRAVKEGTTKKIISKRYTNNSLSTENNYIIYLLRFSVPHYVTKLFLLNKPKENFIKIVIIFITVFCVGIGYFQDYQKG